MGTKTKTATSTSSSAPWSAQQPYIKGVMSEALKQYNSQGPAYFPGSTVTGFAPEQQESFTSGMDHARASADFNTNMMNGQYLNSNPYNDAVFQNIQSKIMPAVNSQFSGAGRYGSNLHADTASRALTESYAPYASQQYQQGLDRMTNAANNFTPYASMEGIGQQRQQMAQSELDDAINRYNYYQDLPSNKLRELAGFVGANYGSNTTSTTPYQQPSTMSQILGGGLGLAGLLL